MPDKSFDHHVVPAPSMKLFEGESDNYCHGAQPIEGFENWACAVDGVVQALEQAGTNVTAGYTGDRETDHVPITDPYWKAGLCPVNVHWHTGAEHLSVGQFDEHGAGPAGQDDHRRLAGEERMGFRCHYYDEADPKFTTEYNWQHCVNTKVGETYEVHWPHSALGACGTPYQYQTPFYDGVFCNIGLLTSTSQQIGVQGQVFTIVNDEDYYYPDLMRGMIVDAAKGMGVEITKYTGSTTGTSRDNEICSRYTPITWQVDRTCHLISASTFDKMCADMKQQADDMSGDLMGHGARELVDDALAADNHQNRRA
jgi:hypothetical protein